MKLEIFKPEDFPSCPTSINSSVYTMLTSHSAAHSANHRLNEWLEKNSTTVCRMPIVGRMSNWTELTALAKIADNHTETALLICIEPVEECKHPKEKIMASATYFGPGNMVLTCKFICQCGVKVQPKEFEEIDG